MTLGLLVLWLVMSKDPTGQSVPIPVAENSSRNLAVPDEKIRAYTSEEYGFAVSIESEMPLYGVNCAMNSYHAYSPITTIPLTFKKTECVWNQDPVADYIEKSQMISLVSIYDLTKCLAPQPSLKEDDTSIRIGDDYFCRAVAALPIQTVQKVTGFGDEMSQRTTLVLKNEKYLIQFEGADSEGSDLDVITVIPTPITKSTQVYQDYVRGFSFEYPSGYEVKVDVEKAEELDLSVRKIGDQEEAKNIDGVCADCTFRLQVLSKFIGGSGKGDFKTPGDWVKFQQGIGARYVQSTVAGDTAYALTEQESGRTTHLIFRANGSLYDRYDLEVESGNNAANTILTTFKFTK